MLRLGVLISGSGSNLQAILDAIARGRLDARVELVISSRPDAYGLVRAAAAGIPTIALSREVYNEPHAADQLIAEEFGRTGLAAAPPPAAASGPAATPAPPPAAAGPPPAAAPGVDYIVMAGYMRKLTEPVLEAYPNRILNIHPALLPAFPGAHSIADAFTYGVKLTGVSVHFVNAEYDRGPIIAQRPVPVEEDDTLESLEAKIHAAEHALYPEVLQLLAEGRVVLDSQTSKVKIL
ncbi:MAG: phosphoribosylglycinamide formyltransferase [Coriobacteriales bacterium]|jgi:phosphoribosylglycinamide formyltransferase-1|nr:phosphoribosylglycinamide formyltransferase [Coriobacteriales bacterium]